MRSAAVFLAGFALGVLVSTPPWARRYLLIGAVLCVAFVVIVLPRRKDPHGPATDHK